MENRKRDARTMALIHFHPLELYPPVMNMLNYLSREYTGEIKVFTHLSSRYDRQFEADNISFVRNREISGRSVVGRQWAYLYFVIRVFFHLLRIRPDTIFYYETNSALPVYLYYKLFRRAKTRLLIHYHEYNSIPQYRDNMKFVYYSYLAEKKNLWKRAAWISHTNVFRRDFFMKDYPELKNIRVLPNYPPASWIEKTGGRANREEPLKLVYVGSLGIDNFHIVSLCEWMKERKEQFTLTIYTHNFTSDVKDYLDSLHTENIRVIYGGAWYYDLPSVLKQFDVGLILYRDFSDNYIYNETNKLFEYLACGLDVWFPEETKGIYQHITDNTFPKVLKVNFSKLNTFDPGSAVSREGLSYLPLSYTCESVYREVLNLLNKS